MNFMHTSLNYIEQAAKDCTSGCFIMAVTVLSSVAGNQLLSKYLFKKREEEIKQALEAHKKQVAAAKKKMEQHKEKAEKPFKDFKSPNYYLLYVNTEF